MAFQQRVKMARNKAENTKTTTIEVETQQNFQGLDDQSFPGLIQSKTNPIESESGAPSSSVMEEDVMRESRKRKRNERSEQEMPIPSETQLDPNQMIESLVQHVERELNCVQSKYEKNPDIDEVSGCIKKGLSCLKVLIDKLINEGPEVPLLI